MNTNDNINENITSPSLTINLAKFVLLLIAIFTVIYFYHPAMIVGLIFVYLALFFSLDVIILSLCSDKVDLFQQNAILAFLTTFTYEVINWRYPEAHLNAHIGNTLIATLIIGSVISIVQGLIVVYNTTIKSEFQKN